MRTLERRTLLLATGALAAAGVTGCGSGGTAATDPVAPAVTRRTVPASAASTAVGAIEHLTVGLYAGLSRTPGNLAFSPLSIGVALAMAVNGAAGRTRRQMLEVLGADDVDDLGEGMNALLAQLQSLEVEQKVGDERVRVVLDIADGIFAQRGYAYERAFLDALARDYGAQLETVDFVGDTEGARAAINEWTDVHTAGLIPEILAPGALDPATRLVLVNAVHLLASWATQFGEPRDAPFRLATGETVAVSTMSGGAADGYRCGDGWQSARLPYLGVGQAGLAMTVILPDDGRLGDVEAQVGRGGIAGFLPRAGVAAVTMPTWTVTTSVGLTGVLGRLGMPDAFDDRADFGRITRTEPLHISDVVHQAVVKVDQFGTEAAAATAVVFAGATGSSTAPAQLVIDRPFVFVIHDLAHRTPLFLGRVEDPRPQ